MNKLLPEIIILKRISATHNMNVLFINTTFKTP